MTESGSPLVPLFSVFATAITIAVFLSPWKTIQEIKASKNVGSLSCVPFISTFMNCFLWITYGYFSGNNVLILVNGVGLICSIYYIFTYHSNIARLEKDKLNKTLIIEGTILGAILFYIFYVSGANDQVFNMGIFASVFSIIMFAAPLEKTLTVIRTKSTESMIFMLSLMSVLCAASWAILGYVIGDRFMMVPNLMATGLSLLQLTLFAVYPSSTAASKISSPVLPIFAPKSVETSGKEFNE